MSFKTRRLPCKLTDTELLIRGHKMSQLHDEIVDAEADKKLKAKAADEGIKRQKQSLRDLATEVKTKEEYRSVAIREEKVLNSTDYNGRSVWEMQTFRLDTGELVDTRPLTHDELQRDLVVVGMHEAKEKKAAVGAAPTGVAGDTSPPEPGKRGKRAKQEEATRDDGPL